MKNIEKEFNRLFGDLGSYDEEELFEIDAKKLLNFRSFILKALSDQKKEIRDWVEGEQKINKAVEKNGDIEYARGKSKAFGDLIKFIDKL
jgi:hypothetical protein